MTTELIVQSLTIISALVGVIKKLRDELKRRKSSERLLYKMSLRVGEEPFVPCRSCGGGGVFQDNCADTETCRTCLGTGEIGYFTGDPNYKKLENGL